VKRYNLYDRIDLNLNLDLFQMVVCWRAHLSKIVRLEFNPEMKLLFSASQDESCRFVFRSLFYHIKKVIGGLLSKYNNLRVWWGNKGRFVGFLGQKNPFNIPRRDTYELTPPIDITEVIYVFFVELNICHFLFNTF
jgi:hypothetical protein